MAQYLGDIYLFCGEESSVRICVLRWPIDVGCCVRTSLGHTGTLETVVVVVVAYIYKTRVSMTLA